MATTTNYGWTTPDDTALVKDGASAIRALGTAIDTSMNTALGTKKAGLVLLNTQTFSAVSSVSFPNNTFSSTYKNYQLLCSVIPSTSSVAINIRMRASGSDNTTSNYQQFGSYSGFTATPTQLKITSQTTWLITTTGTQCLMSMDIFRPFETAKTNSLGFWWNNTTGDVYNGSLDFNTTTSFDSLTLYTATGGATLEGEMSIYGYNK